MSLRTRLFSFSYDSSQSAAYCESCATFFPMVSRVFKQEGYKVYPISQIDCCAVSLHNKVHGIRYHGKVQKRQSIILGSRSNTHHATDQKRHHHHRRHRRHHRGGLRCWYRLRRAQSTWVWYPVSLFPSPCNTPPLPVLPRLGLITHLVPSSTGSLTANPSTNPPNSPPGTRGIVGDLTYYAPGLGACGRYNTANDNICAISHITYDKFANGPNPNTNPLCGRQIRASRNGESVVVTVVDRCECIFGSSFAWLIVLQRS